MNTQKIFKNLLVLFLFFSNLTAISQCLNTGGIGSFSNTTNFNTDWFSATEGNASIDATTIDPYYGTSALKVDVTAESTWQVRMYNRSACYFPITSGQEYTVSFYAKGKVGNDFTVTFMNDATDLISINQEIQLDEWMFYTLKFTSTTTSPNGRIKFNFLNVGSYYIDEIVVKTGGFKTWYVSPTGTNSIAGSNGLSASVPLKTIGYAINTAWTTGDIIYVMNGTYTNNNYGSGNKNNGTVVSINKAGTLNGPLVIRNHPGHSPKVLFDGAGGFNCGTGEYLEISGFEIQGPNQQITKTEAEANRLNTLNYYEGRGIAVWAGTGGHHILLHSNKVYDCPGSGIRINNSDYCTITNNEVNNCTTWTSSGSSAIVLAQSKNIDNTTKIKMRITKNRVYDNVNNIHYFNPSYACPNPTAYGCVDYPNIIDGSGCYITRNNDRGTGGPDENPNGQYIGAFYFANNVSYGNGINGVVVHKSDNSIVMNNTVYKNGQVPLSEGRQSAAGITVNDSNNVRIYNNISWTQNTSDYGYKFYNAISNVQGRNNILITGKTDIAGLTNMITANPLFQNHNNFDFTLTSSSPAIDAGVLQSQITTVGTTIAAEYIPYFDIQNVVRPLNNSDIGAYEFPTTVISDTTPPVITLNGNATITIEVGQTYTDQGATASDNVDGNISANIIVGGDVVNSSIPGTYLVTYNVVDTAGNSALEVTRTIIVEDTTPPVITLNGNANVNINAGIVYTDLGATATDNVDGDISANIIVGGDTVNTNVPGVYVITYNVNDVAGNAATEVTRTVNVILLNSKINSVNGPSSILEEGSVSITVSYESHQNNDIVLMFQKDNGNYQVYQSVLVPVSAGIGSINIPLTLLSTVPVANNNYQYQVYITAPNDSWNNRFHNLRQNNITVLPLVPEINITSAPTTVTSGGTANVSLNYTASQESDVVVIFQRDNNPYTSYETIRNTVAKGQGTVNVNLNILSSIPVANNDYQYKAFIAPVGGTLGTSFYNTQIKDVSVISASQKNSGGKNKDAIVNNFNNEISFNNPIKTELIIRGLDENSFSLQVFSMLGQKVIDKRNITPNLNSYKLNLYSLKKGIYIVNIYQSGVYSSKKILKLD